MSEVLYTHYNTILYRLQRIKEITGLDVEKENDRLCLHLALKIRDVIKN
ncbi:helix-turn-helix domain-containing protein [Caloramator sp. Dgby_cultured_2]|nr:helix-turn-helix domain-containing protein [Caloramator sp. Dgby_cultured_2]WDU82417.1 helix-turn-helix domain-containing protein [Caloramator sp. Dgby_cultured_2]